MSATPAPNGSPGVEAAEKLALCLAASLLLHLGLIFGVQIRPPESAARAVSILQARLVEPSSSPEPRKAEALPAQEEKEMELQGSEPLLPPKPELKPEPTKPAPEPAPPVPAAPASAITEEKGARGPSVPVPMIEDPTYYTATEVDIHPLALKPIQPEYPDAAGRDNVSGSVILVLLLDEGGAVREASVEEASPPGYFEASALEAFRKARFSPAQRHGKAVKSRVRIKVTYDLVDRKKGE